jgi:hypothetical protein
MGVQMTKIRGARRAGLRVAVALSVLGLAPIALLETPAGAASTFAVTGQIQGGIPWSPTLKNQYGVLEAGCELTQTSTEIDLAFPNTKVTLNGKSVEATDIGVSVVVNKLGDTEKNGGTFATGHFVLNVTVGSKDFDWVAATGTVSTKAGGDGGSVNAVLDPAWQLMGIKDQSGSATKSVHISGTWASCLPYGKAA